MRVEDLGQVWFLLFDELFEFGNLSDLFERKHFIFLVSVHSQASGILQDISGVGTPICSLLGASIDSMSLTSR